ncbi:MAG: hypothetical protein HPY90_13330 [Syntrophothermus sp.]|uniref:hypothetical protein n=1 Tax=Syntrophothermus sp. TaxID=2736299 RepID=UPI00257DE5D2|nr:hypothetical protein [Syntrophothermus sp.]NSW84231.1 hypothetical protein [Syntrophothermus sp.]
MVLVLSLLVTASGIILATLFLPVAAGTGTEELRAVRLGRPFWFVVQDQSRYSPLGDVWITRLLSPWECPFAVVWWRFLASCAAVAGLLWLVLRAVALLPGRRAGAGRA